MHAYKGMCSVELYGYPVHICVALAEFCHVILCMYVCVCVYMWPKRLPVWGLTTWNSPVGKTYCSLIEFNQQKRHLQCQTIHSGKEIWKHSINEVGESQEFQNIVLRYATPCLSQQWSYAMQTNAERPLWNANMQLRTYNIATGTVYWLCLACTGYVFCGTLVMNAFC